VEGLTTVQVAAEVLGRSDRAIRYQVAKGADGWFPGARRSGQRAYVIPWDEVLARVPHTRLRRWTSTSAEPARPATLEAARKLVVALGQESPERAEELLTDLRHHVDYVRRRVAELSTEQRNADIPTAALGPGRRAISSEPPRPATR
jgi:hypothetical protein